MFSVPYLSLHQHIICTSRLKHRTAAEMHSGTNLRDRLLCLLFHKPRISKCSRGWRATMNESHLSLRRVRLLTMWILTFRHGRPSTLLCLRSSTLFLTLIKFSYFSYFFCFVFYLFRMLCIYSCRVLVAFSLTNVFFTFVEATKPFSNGFSSKSLVLDSCYSKAHQLCVSLPVSSTMVLSQIMGVDHFYALAQVFHIDFKTCYHVITLVLRCISIFRVLR